MRSKVIRGRDKLIFRKSADRVKAINVRPIVQRGGIRM